MRVRVLFLMCLFLTFNYLKIRAQVNSIVILEYAKQITALKNGILIVELPPVVEPGIRTNKSVITSGSRSAEEVNSIKESFIKKYHFSKFYFYNKEEQLDKFLANISTVEDVSGNKIVLNNLDIDVLFIAEYVDDHIDQPECYYLKNGKPGKAKASPASSNDFSKESSLYNPEILVEGGIIIRRYSPSIRAINKKKSLVSDFIYKRRVHLTLPVSERFTECVYELNLKLEKDYTKSLKYYSNTGPLK